MDSALAVFLSWQFFLFSLCIAGITFVIRKLVEYFLERSTPVNVHPTQSKLWSSLVLPLLPLFSGLLLALVSPQYSYPDGIVSTSSRLIFGFVAGMLSGLLYKIVNGMLKDKLPQEISSKLPSEIVPEVKAENKVE